MPYNVLYHSQASFTVSCAAGSGPSVTEHASASSPISQRAADDAALSFAREKALNRLQCEFPPAPDEVRFFSEERQASSTCPEGTAGFTGPFDPDKVFEVTIPASAIYSLTSVQQANEAAETYANFELSFLLSRSCRGYFENTEQTATVTCPPFNVGDPSSDTVPAGEFTSFINQQAADDQAYALALANAQAALVCTQAFPNEAQSYTAECPVEGPFGPDVTVTIPAGVYYDATVEDANATALAAATAQATAALVCGATYSNTVQTVTLTCEEVYQEPVFGSGAFVTVPAGTYFSDISEAAANAEALAAAEAEALLNLDCFCPEGCNPIAP